MKMSAFQIRALQCFEGLRGSGGTDRLQGVMGLPWRCPPTWATKTSQKETVGSEGPRAEGSEKRTLGSCWRDQKEEMLRSLPVGDEDGGGDQVPLGCYEGCPGHGGLWGHL